MRLERTQAKLSEHVAAFTATALLLCRFSIDVPELEAKIVLGRHVYDQVLAADRLRQRALALGVELNPVVSSERARCREELVRASHATTTQQKLECLYEVVIPKLASSVAEHLGEPFGVVDEPTAELLRDIGQRLAAQIEAGRTLITNLKQTFPDAFAQELTRDPLPHAEELDLRTPPRPARDRRFDGATRPAKVTPSEPLAELLPALLHSNLLDLEIPSIEACSRAILDFGARMPWEFVVDMARQCYDEARHAQAFLQRFLEVGGRLGDYAISNRLWDMASGQPLEVRLGVHQRIGERTGVDGAIWFSEMLQAHGDTSSAELFEYVAQDEVAHVAYGSKWMKFLTGSAAGLREAHLRSVRRRAEFSKSGGEVFAFPLRVEACERAGFSADEIADLEARYEEHGSVFPERAERG